VFAAFPTRRGAKGGGKSLPVKPPSAPISGLAGIFSKKLNSILAEYPISLGMFVLFFESLLSLEGVR
jgi:hypothetical protein